MIFIKQHYLLLRFCSGAEKLALEGTHRSQSHSEATMEVFETQN
jgi:hypothetical protein